MQVERENTMREEKMNRTRKTAIIAGVLFITATVAGILSTVFTGPVLGAPDYLLKFSANGNQVLIGALFAFIGAAASASIAISLYPILKKYNEGLALGSVGFRLIEGVLDIVSIIGLLLLLTLSQAFVKAGAPNASYFQTLGVVFLAGYDWVLYVGAVLAFYLGALMYYYIFYQTKLIPRWLSGWGLVGVTLGIGASLLVMFRVIGPFSTIQVVLNLPIGVQEMVLAVWLIVKGFNSSAIASGSAKTELNDPALRISS
jgi:Domain of unknown function (DUF4386)